MSDEMTFQLISNGVLLTLNSDREIIKSGWIFINNNRIERMGRTEDFPEDLKNIESYNAHGRLIMPGLINSHVHAGHILLRGGPSQDKNHLEWLSNVLYPALNSYDEEAVEAAYELFCIEAIRSGTTTIVDNVVWGARENLTFTALETLRAAGMRAIHAHVFSDLSSTEQLQLLDIMQRKDPLIKRIAFPKSSLKDTLNYLEKLIKKYHHSNDGLISIWPAPGIPIYVSREGLHDALEIARANDVMFSIHLAETISTSTFQGMSIIEYLNFIKILDPRLVAAHCVWVSDYDMRLLKANDVKVVNNVVSNMFLGSGIAPISRMADLGILVGLGTDDVNCNNTANMFTDMKICALAQKVKELNASAITAEKVLEMATIDNARVIGMEQQIGSLEVGKLADLIVIDLEKPNLKPCFHIPSTLVYQANGLEVDSVMVNGKWLMKEKQISFLQKSEEEVFQKAQEASLKVLTKSGMSHLCDRGWVSSYPF